jgi:hypothetical protein
VLQHDQFYVIRRSAEPGAQTLITVSHEVPADAVELGVFEVPGDAIDFAQEQVTRLKAGGQAAQYVDPPDDLVGGG